MLSLPVRIRPAIVLFGDSITQQGFGWTGAAAGWASLLARDYSRRADVLNRGFSGYSTRMALDLLPGIFPGAGAGAGGRAPDVTRGEVLFATVFFGANDAALPGERQHVPPEEYARNLRLIVEHVRGSGTPGRTAPGEGEGEGGGGGGAEEEGCLRHGRRCEKARGAGEIAWCGCEAGLHNPFPPPPRRSRAQLSITAAGPCIAASCVCVSATGPV